MDDLIQMNNWVGGPLYLAWLQKFLRETAQENILTPVGGDSTEGKPAAGEWGK